MGYVTWPRPLQARVVICRLGLAMFNPHIKFELSTVYDYLQRNEGQRQM